MHARVRHCRHTSARIAQVLKTSAHGAARLREHPDGACVQVSDVIEGRENVLNVRASDCMSDAI